ncbi:MAG: ParA family protein [Acidimicrobiales bacterium]
MLWASSKPTKLVRRLIAGAKADADLVVIDCPPGLSPVVEAVANVADLLLVPVVPEPLPFRALALRGLPLRHQGRVAHDRRPLPLHGRPEPPDAPAHRGRGARLEAGSWQAAIPTSSAVARMGEEQVPAVLAAPRSLAASEHRKLWAEAQGAPGCSRRRRARRRGPRGRSRPARRGPGRAGGRAGAPRAPPAARRAVGRRAGSSG